MPAPAPGCGACRRRDVGRADHHHDAQGVRRTRTTGLAGNRPHPRQSGIPVRARLDDDDTRRAGDRGRGGARPIPCVAPGGGADGGARGRRCRRDRRRRPGPARPAPSHRRPGRRAARRRHRPRRGRRPRHPVTRSTGRRVTRSSAGSSARSGRRRRTARQSGHRRVPERSAVRSGGPSRYLRCRGPATRRA